MSLLFETIRIERGMPVHLPYHETRMQASAMECLGIHRHYSLKNLIVVPPEFSSDPVKCRVFYDHQVERIDFELYVRRKISRLRVVDAAGIDYCHKFTDRSVLDRLLAQRGDADDILIVHDGLVTDASYANLIFFDGGRWLTPRHPLLRGTCRQRLLDEGLIVEKDILVTELGRFMGFKLINAMLDPTEQEMTAIRNGIIF
jgi:4-amino-4-deoxychorismate lyase